MGEDALNTAKKENKLKMELRRLCTHASAVAIVPVV
jgi:hypothetical protein